MTESTRRKRDRIGSIATKREDCESFYHLSGATLTGGVCGGLACFVARSVNPDRWLAAEAQKPRIYCLGKCFAGPAACDVDPRPRVQVRSREAIVLAHIVAGGARSLDGYLRQQGYRALEGALGQSPADVVEAMESSGLRGRGGAGYPTGKKWRATLNHPSSEKHIVANGDEGDPGAFSDRVLMEDDPHAILEGMAIAAYAVGANKGWIYIRGEYPQAAAAMKQAATEARLAGFLGDRILGGAFAFDVQIVVGRGSYVCGEETSLLNSIEGKRPVALARPPYAAESGLFGKPTVVNNIETFANVPWIVLRGAQAYRQFGISRSQGTKLVSLNSLFRRPGLYEVEFGTSVRQIVEDLGGGLETGALKGVMIGGPLAGVIPPHLLDTPFGFEELAAIHASVGHGGVIGFDQHTSIAQLVHHVFSFGAYESCGQCVPCRLGSRRVEKILEQVISAGKAPKSKRAEFEEIVELLGRASLCGLGSGLAEFARTILLYYQEELDQCFA